MKYPKIIAEIERTQWAITPEALHGIEKAVDKGLTAEDYALFHKSEAISDFDSEKPTIVDGKGLLVINGPIVPRAKAFTRASGLVAIDKLTSDFKALEADESVKEIRFLVDSPGGAVTGTSDFAQLIKASSKPTKAFIVGQAASAAYWIVSAADQIVASDTSISGSIGIVLTYDTIGEKRQIVSAQSPDKRPDLETEKGRAVLQRQVNEVADVFVETVARNRGVSVDTVLKDFGRGASVVAKRALSVGMIDEISTINDFMASKKDDKKYKTERLASLETTPAGISKRQGAEKQKPASAGERNAAMTLTEFLAENPAAKAEFEATKAEEFGAGKAAGVAEMKATNEKLCKMYEAKGYPEKFKNFVILAFKGERTFEAIQAMADYHDMSVESENSAAAQEESEGLPETTPIGEAAGPSENGQLKTAADVDNWWKEMKSGNGEMEVANGCAPIPS
jgi:ClpP class serine protease